MQHDDPWQTIHSKTVYQDQWITLKHDDVLRPEGGPGTYAYIESSDSVLIVAVNNNNHVYMEWTYRYPTKSWGWELPGGGVGDDEPLIAAQRELSEEMGYTAQDWSKIGSPHVYDGVVTSSVHVFVACDVKRGEHLDADDNEITNTGRFFSIAEIEQMIIDQQLKDVQAIAALSMYKISLTI